jgi:hypothetical protein
MRRFTRLTNAFSKKLEKHAHGGALCALVQLCSRSQEPAGLAGNGARDRSPAMVDGRRASIDRSARIFFWARCSLDKSDAIRDKRAEGRNSVMDCLVDRVAAIRGLERDR